MKIKPFIFSLFHSVCLPAILSLSIVLHSSSDALAEDKPSFECKEAKSSVEKLICNDDGLKEQDSTLTETYKQALKAYSGSGDKQLQADQLDWLKLRSEVCSITPVTLQSPDNKEAIDCLSGFYLDRIKVLSLETENAKVTVHFPATRHPFTPSLIENNDKKICSKFERSVQQSYFAISPFPDLPISGGYWVTNNRRIVFPVHVDDGKQTLLYDSWPSRGNVYYYRIYLKDGEPNAELLEKEKNWPASEDELAQQGWAAVVPSYDSAVGSPFKILQMHNSLYLLRDGRLETDNNQEQHAIPDNALALYQINKDGTLKLTCEVMAGPQITNRLANKKAKKPDATASTEEPKAVTEFLNDLRALDVSGEGRCGGSHTGFVWFSHTREFDSATHIALREPWKLSDSEQFDPNTKAMSYIKSWGISSLYNYHIYQKLMHDLPAATQSLKELYMKQYGLQNDVANSIAERAVAEIIAGSMHFDGTVRWDEVNKNAVDIIEFRHTYQKALAEKEVLSSAFIQRSILSNMEDLISETPDEQLKTTPSKEEWGSADSEPFIIYALDKPSTMDLLLRKGVDVNARNWFGKTALMYAAQWNLLDSTKLLINSHADVNVATPVAGRSDCEAPATTGRTALMYAAENAEAPLIELLIKSGADTKAKNSMGWSFQDYLAANKLLTKDERERIIEELSKDERTVQR